MATEEQLAQALRNADKAGDTDAARKLAAALSKMRGAQPAEPQTTAEGLIGSAIRGGGLTAAAAGTGALLGGVPTGGIGAIPGALTGAAISETTQAVADPLTSLVNRTFGTNYQLPSEALQDFFTRMGVAEPKTEAERVVRQASETAGEAAGLAGLAGSLSKIVTNPTAAASLGVLAQNPAAQIVGGATSGGAAQYSAEQGGDPTDQLLAGLVGGVVGSYAALPRIPMASTQVAQRQADVAAAERSGIPVMTSDVMEPRSWLAKWGQTTGERIPFAGTGGVRAAQGQARVDAVKEYVISQGADDVNDAVEKTMADMLKVRQDQLTKFTSMKQASYDASPGVVPVKKATAEIDKQIAAIKSLNSAQYAPLVNMLDDYKKAIQNQNVDNIDTLRKSIGKALDDQQFAAIRSLSDKYTRPIYRALKDDIGDHILTVGGQAPYARWRVAMKNLADTVADTKEKSIRAVLNSGDATPENVRTLLFSKKPSVVRALYARLSPEGKASARRAVIAEAASKSIPVDGDIASISPEKFASAVSKMSAQKGVMFSGDDLLQLNGLVRALSLTSRGGQAGVVPPTGVQAVPYLAADVLSGQFGGPTGATAAAAAVGLGARIYESKAVRNLLIRLPQVKRGSADESEIFKRLNSAILAEHDAEQKE